MALQDWANLFFLLNTARLAFLEEIVVANRLFYPGTWWSVSQAPRALLLIEHSTIKYEHYVWVGLAISYNKSFRPAPTVLQSTTHT